MAAELLWLQILLVGFTHSQRMELASPRSEPGICKGSICRNQEDLDKLKNCVVILGNLQLQIEKATLKNTSYDVREITEYLVVYRVVDLDSIGYIFPNLTRIRGVRLLHNYALVIFENLHLREIGLYNLLKIDRGGVIAWMLPQACYVDTINWQVLAPNARHVITSNKQIQCNVNCRCSSDPTTNRCWNVERCQRFIEGPDALECHEECLGCRLTNASACQVCRHFTYKGNCVPKCPPNSARASGLRKDTGPAPDSPSITSNSNIFRRKRTKKQKQPLTYCNVILLPDNQYCITEKECTDLGMLVLNNTCLAHCPIGYIDVNVTGKISCKICTNCQKTCPTQVIRSLGTIEAAERCVYINGSLKIHMRYVLGTTASLKKYLYQIEEIADFIEIESSDALTSLDFLPSLKRIKGNRLKDKKYSLFINNNPNLQTLFTSNVIKNLVIEKGVVKFENNHKLCLSEIDKTKKLLTEKANLEFDIHEGTNGYAGGCEEATFNIDIHKFADPTSVKIEFSPIRPNVYYSVLYTRLPPGVHNMNGVPETCSEFEWLAVDVPTENDRHIGIVNLTSLRPASTYFLCIEIYDMETKRLARSNLSNFTTPVGTPAPPFMVELVASSSDLVVIHWVNHRDYAHVITHYKLDVSLIEAKKYVIDYCKHKDEYTETDFTRHALVRTPPPNYGKACESMCGILSSVTKGAMTEEYFDICDDETIRCDHEEIMTLKNSSYGQFVRTLVLNINGSAKSFQVGGLAPYSDYKFSLRACCGNNCSRSTRGAVRTFNRKDADIPSVSNTFVNQSGYITVTWGAPNISNGPILSYSVEVLPYLDAVNLMPQTWCVLENQKSFVVKSVITTKYKVRVCAKTLASDNSCSQWTVISTPQSATVSTVSWWMAVICGFIIFFASGLIGWYLKVRRSGDDAVPIIDSMSWSGMESEPVVHMFSDFMPFYSSHFE